LVEKSQSLANFNVWVNKMKKSLSIIIACLAWVGVILADNREDLRFTIFLEKSVYHVDEPIYLEMLATNLSKHEVYILPMRLGASWGHFKLILRDQNDKTLDYYGVEAYMYSPPNWDGFIMAPGERWLLVHDLLDMFGKRVDVAHQFSFVLSPGTYTIQAVYHTNPKAYTGKNPEQEDKQTLYSNILRFEVAEPLGSQKVEHEKVLAVLTAYNMEYEKKETKNPRRQIAALEEFINENPNSVYLPLVYSYLHICYSINGYATERQNLVQKILARFPDSGLAYKLLKYERFDELNKLAQALIITQPMIMQNLKIASPTNRASFYAQCLVEMQRIELRTAERMKQARGNR
jgi:tetratricopeptide (TPR) repeat protein